MPYTTPSPYRFRPANSSSRDSDQDTRQPRSEQQQQQRPPPLRAFHPLPKAQPLAQFAATPRFTSGRPKSRQDEPPSPQPPHNFAQSFRSAGIPREDVEDPAEANGETGHVDDDEMLDPAEPQDVLPITELHPRDNGDEDKIRASLPFSPKRRKLEDRVSHAPFAEDAAQPLFETPKHHPPSFRHPSSTDPAPTPVPRPPSFIRPSAAPLEPPPPPLPEAFSPHRRGHKFLPGGMASTVQGWILETGQIALQNQKRRGYALGGEGEGWDCKGVVLEVKGSGLGSGPWMTRLTRDQGGGEEVRVVLTGAGGGAAPSKRAEKEVKVGTAIGMRAPTWIVMLEGREWMVGVDWKVLDPLS